MSRNSLNPACYHTALWAIDRLTTTVNVTLRSEFFLLFSDNSPWIHTVWPTALRDWYRLVNCLAFFLDHLSKTAAAPPSLTRWRPHLKNVFLCVIINRYCMTLLAHGDPDLVSCCMQTHLRHSVASWENPFRERNTDPFLNQAINAEMKCLCGNYSFSSECPLLSH